MGLGQITESSSAGYRRAGLADLCSDVQEGLVILVERGGIDVKVPVGQPPEKVFHHLRSFPPLPQEGLGIAQLLKALILHWLCSWRLQQGSERSRKEVYTTDYHML